MGFIDSYADDPPILFSNLLEKRAVRVSERLHSCTTDGQVIIPTPVVEVAEKGELVGRLAAGVRIVPLTV